MSSDTILGNPTILTSLSDKIFTNPTIDNTLTVSGSHYVNNILVGGFCSVASLELDTTKNGGSKWGVYSNGTGAGERPKTLNIFDYSLYKSFILCDASNGGVRINDGNGISPAVFAVSGLRNLVDNSAAKVSGLIRGDIYYTATGTDGVLKVVI